jgi:periplasmic mercuric ion binding protein
MKHIIIGILFSLIAFVNSAQKKNITEQTITVNGKCGDCKERIETAADIKGVKLAIWNPETKSLKLVFRNDKTSLEKIKQAVAKAGYESEGVTADEKAYAKLPECCKYKLPADEGVKHNK